ncbi:hypothetical protein L227DRAFT_23786 [Lentinus tigrinus ALCF2SS1-6]|uniref:Uncharacterized protein n=1 Tax=Lentinus tigrinus ALCF2SS1-6 TaxID=1328759 RepID=A0A5C2SU69_9APHY|nr:hypothetical protein L227DRAFT_23786 [Lentinus tigrinus ALCF2SS1-6]
MRSRDMQQWLWASLVSSDHDFATWISALTASCCGRTPLKAFGCHGSRTAWSSHRPLDQCRPFRFALENMATCFVLDNGNSLSVPGHRKIRRERCDALPDTG